MRLDTLYRKGNLILTEAGVPNANLDAWYLMEEAAGVTRSDLYVHPEKELDEEICGTYLDWIERRKERIPLQRILGKQEFMGLEFLVGEQVLIPRQDTEILVETAMQILEDGMQVCDMCTGTGCIAWSLAALSQKEIRVDAVDVSEEAIQIAGANRERLGLDKNLTRVIQSDLFEKVQDRYDVIVSNPPYIRPDVIETLEPEVRDHDPRLALDGGADGLVFYRKIVDRAQDHLKEGGYLFFEIGYDQGDEVSQILADHTFTEIRIIPDLTGLNRVVTGKKMC